MTWPPPSDCTGGLTGAWRVLELLDELDESEFESEFAELEEVELLAGVPELPAVLCVAPGSAAATAPAASTLATPTVTVAVFSLRRPRSRSATARETCRAAAWPRGTPVGSSQLSIIAVWHASLYASFR